MLLGGNSSTAAQNTALELPAGNAGGCDRVATGSTAANNIALELPDAAAQPAEAQGLFFCLPASLYLPFWLAGLPDPAGVTWVATVAQPLKIQPSGSQPLLHSLRKPEGYCFVSQLPHISRFGRRADPTRRV